MGCGPSRPSAPPGPKRPTDCSGSYCDLYYKDLPSSKDPLVAIYISHEIFESMLMDYNTFVRYVNTVMIQINENTTLVRDHYPKIMNFLNENVEYIGDERLSRLRSAMSGVSNGAKDMFDIYTLLIFKAVSGAPQGSWGTWYNRYSRVLRDAAMTSNSPDDILRRLETWVEENPQPAVELFTDLITELRSLKNLKNFRNLSNNTPLISIINEVKLDNKKISGFTNYTTLKNGFTNQYHSF